MREEERGRRKEGGKKREEERGRRNEGGSDASADSPVGPDCYWL